MKSEKYCVAGKTFILGEYAVLAGRPALVAAIPPRFEMAVEEVPRVPKPDAMPPASDSPLARLQSWALKMGFPDLTFYFKDPYQGRGGFGASTAEFAMAYLAYVQRKTLGDRKWNPVWKLYRELMGNQPLVPSGADLVAQWQGGVVFFDPSDGYCMDLWPLFNWATLLVFSATDQVGRKVPTHQHLDTLLKRGFPESDQPLLLSLERSLLQGVAAIRENDPPSLGKAFGDYADALARAGLEAPATQEDRRALEGLHGVLGVKGCGAFQADSILVLMEPACSQGSTSRQKVIEAATKRGLRLVSDGLTCQMGIVCQTSE